MIRRALILACLAALVLVPASVMAARKHRVTALAFAYSITVSPDPLTTGDEPGTVTATTDVAGWLRMDTPCVRGWVNLAPGTSSVQFYRATGCEGDYTFTITSAGDADGGWVDLYSVTVATS